MTPTAGAPEVFVNVTVVFCEDPGETPLPITTLLEQRLNATTGITERRWTISKERCSRRSTVLEPLLQYPPVPPQAYFISALNP